MCCYRNDTPVFGRHSVKLEGHSPETEALVEAARMQPLPVGWRKPRFKWEPGNRNWMCVLPCTDMLTLETIKIAGLSASLAEPFEGHVPELKKAWLNMRQLLATEPRLP